MTLLLLLGFALTGCLAPPSDSVGGSLSAPRVRPAVAEAPAQRAKTAAQQPRRERRAASDIALRAESIERQARQLTVRLRASGCGDVSTGSGFAISRSVVATNWHVVEGATEVELNTWDGRSSSAEIVAFAYANDLALISTAEPLRGAATLATLDPKPNDHVTVVGYPMGGRQTLSEGHIVDYVPGRRLGAVGNVMRLTAHIEPGNSGGPVLNGDGRVVGVIYAIERATRYALAIPASGLHALLTGGRVDATGGGCDG